MSPSQVGHAAGSMAGAVLAPGVGMPIGALIGTLAGMAVEKEIDKTREGKERIALTEQLNGASPPPPDAASGRAPLGAGRPTRVWVDETVDRGRLVAGHFEVRPIP